MTCLLRVWKGGRGLVLVLALLALSAPVAVTAQEDACVACHRDIPDELLSAPVEGMSSDVHTKHGLSCSDCHGGDPSAIDDFMGAHGDDHDFRGAPGPLAIPAFCARCHGDPLFMKKYDPNIEVDQLQLYRTSIHGVRNAQGDSKVAHCTSCHGVHGIRSANDPLSQTYASNVPMTCSKCHSDSEYMRGYGIPADQLSEYEGSVHGIALLDKGDRTSPACNDCHGNHGAVPPGVTSVSEVCGQCHAAQADLFMASPHKDAHEAMGLPACEVCHGNHGVARPTDSMLGVSEGAVCVNCHDEGSGGYVVAERIRRRIDDLRQSHESVATLVHTAEQAGMMMDEAMFELNEARSALLRSRTAVHRFSVEAVDKEVAIGKEHLASAETAATAALSEISSRRKSLVVLAAVAALMIIALIRKIKESDRAVLKH